jgi:predicted DsbA family dithiol-disulfide isomerase
MDPRSSFATPAALVWGRGEKVLEVFLEPTCPFSARAFGKFDELLARAGAERLTLKIRLQSQPWHLLSPTVIRAILAASMTGGGKEAAKAVMAAVFAHREEFDLVDHCSGPNLDLSIRDVLRRIERYAGIDVSAPFEVPDLQREMKWHARYARQNGVHASPTFMIDGLVAAEMSSGDPVEAWLGKLGLS